MRIVFATDLSNANEAAISSRTCLECLGNVGVTAVDLVTVLPDTTPTGLGGFDVSKGTDAALESQRELFEEVGFDVDVHVTRGTPHRRINGLADRVGAELVVVGSRGQSPLENRLVGSTARNVARTTTRPLLVERILAAEDGHAVAKEHLFQDVLFATDFSENARRAFEFLPALSGATERVTLLHVLGHEGDLDETEALERLEALADELRTKMDVDVTVSVREGGVVEEILAEEARVDSTVTLLGSRGRSRLRRLLLGSVSEGVVAQGRANVLLVPPVSSR